MPPNKVEAKRDLGVEVLVDDGLRMSILRGNIWVNYNVYFLTIFCVWYEAYLYLGSMMITNYHIFDDQSAMIWTFTHKRKEDNIGN